MFVDYVTLMLINMSASLVVLGVFVYKGLEDYGESKKRWAPVFAVCGFVASVCGFAMVFSWPLPKPYNIPFGEMSVFLGVLFLAASWSFTKDYELMPLAIYAILAGLAAVVLGARIIGLGLTRDPLLSGIGFILTGSGGVLAGLVLKLKEVRLVRVLAAAGLLVAAFIWAWTGYTAYWGHMLVE